MGKVGALAALVGLALMLTHQFFEVAGWQISLGFVAGAALFYCIFRMHYGWWPDFNVDGEDTKNRKLPRL